MSRKDDTAFEISFYESVLKREPRYADVIELLGGLYTKTGRITDGLKMDRRLVRLQPDNATAHYNLACSLSLLKRPADALRTLAHAVELGYADAKWMAEDPDLKPLRTRPEFVQLLKTVRARAAVG